MDTNAAQKWEAKTNEIHVLKLETGTDVIVYRHVDWKPETWLLSGRGFLSGFDRVYLQSKGLEAAKEEALDRVYSVLSRLAVRVQLH